MPGQNPTFQDGPVTYEVSANVSGGQGVEFDPATTGGVGASGRPLVKPSAAASTKFVGVAFRDAVPVSARAGFEDGTTAYPGAFVTTDISVPDETVVVYNDAWITVTFTGACAFRGRIKCAAAGAFAAFVEGTDAENLAVGWCAQPGGVASAGKGLARIRV